MEKTEALKSIRALLKVASETDDPKLIQEHLKMMKVIVDKALAKPKAG